jgi:hypothetical protein
MGRISLVILLVFGCDPASNLTEQERDQIIGSTRSKLVTSKAESIENRLSGVDLFFGDGSVTKTQSVYYLVADDGSLCEVGLSTYQGIRVESPYSPRMFDCPSSWVFKK